MIGPPSAMPRAKRSMVFGSNAAGLVGGTGAGGRRDTATQTRTNLSVLCHARAPPRPLRRDGRTTLSKVIPDPCSELHPFVGIHNANERDRQASTWSELKKSGSVTALFQLHYYTSCHVVHFSEETK